MNSTKSPPAPPHPTPFKIREPTLGLPGAARDRCNNDRHRSVQVGFAGARVNHIGPGTLPLQNTWLTPGFTSLVPRKGQDKTGY